MLILLSLVFKAYLEITLYILICYHLCRQKAKRKIYTFLMNVWMTFLEQTEMNRSAIIKLMATKIFSYY